jgi:hypothetical protein
MAWTTIQDGIKELETKLHAEKAIASRFPDAVLRDLGNDTSGWMSDAAQEHVTDIEIVSGSNRTAYVWSYLTVGGMRVYANRMDLPYLYTLVAKVKNDHPAVYKALVDVARGL